MAERPSDAADITTSITTRPATARWFFRLTRLVVLAYVGLLIGMFLYGLFLFPGYVTQHPELFFGSPWTPDALRAALAQLRLSPRALAWYQLTLGLMLRPYWRAWSPQLSSDTSPHVTSVSAYATA